MSLDDAEYAPTYYSILALDTTGVASKCVKPPQVQTTMQWTPNRPQTPRPALREPPHLSTYPNNIPVGTGAGAVRTVPNCFGCGKDDHRMRDCPEIQSLFNDGIVKNDDQTGRLCMKDGAPIRRMYGEHLAQAARRQGGPRVMFGIIDAAGKEELPYSTYHSAHVAFQEFSESSEEDEDEEIESSFESSRIEEFEGDSDDESDIEESEDEGEVYLSIPRRQYRVHAADRTVPSTKAARRSAFDGVHVPRREKVSIAKETKTTPPPKVPGVPLSSTSRPIIERALSSKPKTPAGTMRDILNDVKPYDARAPRESKTQDVEMPDAEAPGKHTAATNKRRKEDEAVKTAPPTHRAASSRSTESAEKHAPPGRQSEIQASVSLPKIVERILDLEVPMSVREVLVSSKEIRNNLQEVIKLKNVKSVLAGAQSAPWTWPRSEGVLIRAEMEIGGRQVVAIIDTGSQLDVVRADVAALVLHRPVDMTKTTGMNDANGGRAIFVDKRPGKEKPRLTLDIGAAEDFSTGRNKEKERDLPEISIAASRGIPRCRCGSLTALDLTDCSQPWSNKDASKTTQTCPGSPQRESARTSNVAALAPAGETTKTAENGHMNQRSNGKDKRTKEDDGGAATTQLLHSCYHNVHELSTCPNFRPHNMEHDPNPPSAPDIHLQKYKEHLDAIQRTINRLEAEQYDHRPIVPNTGFGVVDQRTTASALHAVQAIARGQEAAFREGRQIHVRPGRMESDQVFYLGEDAHRDGQEVQRVAFMNTRVEVLDPATGEYGTKSGHLFGHLYVDPHERKKWKIHMPFPSQQRLHRYLTEAKAEAQVTVSQKLVQKKRRLTESHQKRDAGGSTYTPPLTRSKTPALKNRVASKMKILSKNKISKRTTDDAHYITHPVGLPSPCDTSNMTQIGLTKDKRNVVYRVDTDEVTRLQGKLNRPGTPHPPFALFTERPETVPFIQPPSPSPQSERSFELAWYVACLNAEVDRAEAESSRENDDMEVEEMIAATEHNDTPSSAPITEERTDDPMAEVRSGKPNTEQSADIQVGPTKGRDQWDGEPQIRLPHDQLVEVNRRLADAYRQRHCPPPRSILPLLNDDGSTFAPNVSTTLAAKTLPKTTVTPSGSSAGLNGATSLSPTSTQPAATPKDDLAPASPKRVPATTNDKDSCDIPAITFISPTCSIASTPSSDNDERMRGSHYSEPTSYLLLLAEAAEVVEKQDADKEATDEDGRTWVEIDGTHCGIGITVREDSPLTEPPPSPVLRPVSAEATPPPLQLTAAAPDQGEILAPDSDEDMPELLYLDGTRPGDAVNTPNAATLPIADLPPYRGEVILAPDSDSEDEAAGSMYHTANNDSTSSEPPPTPATNGGTSTYDTGREDSGDEDGFVIVQSKALVTALQDLYCVVPRPAVDECVRIDLWEDEEVLQPALEALKIIASKLGHHVDHEAVARELHPFHRRRGV
ncbi:hypothetical protein R3P38DRAFT_2760211 [Favolaschia claudopus]|uniref:CCHC-type domain-containing protein n=1 Tax=Favolaschia claudopus TaxID=2862362 RepID=A0AAW0E1Z1_9AGAR